jgi:predicted PurR-regulated permease PerM
VVHGPAFRSILRVVGTVVASALALYLLYLLRQPIGYLVLALFIAVFVSAPVNVLHRHMPRGLAIALVYFGIVLMPLGIGAILIPPLVEATDDLIHDLPGYVDDLEATINDSETLKQINDDYDVTEKLQEFSTDAGSGALSSAPTALADIGKFLVELIFQIVTVLVLSMFMVSRGTKWLEPLLRTRPPPEPERIRQTLNRMASAMSGYVAGALAQATIAGIAAFIMLTILGVPSALPLAVIIAVLDLIPLVGATLGAIVVGLFTLFQDFPTITIVWAIFAIVYQQVENYLIQPRIQGRAVKLDPFIVIVAAIFGATLLGITGALLAIPAAAALQIGIREFIEYRREGEATAASEAPTAETAPA